VCGSELSLKVDSGATAVRHRFVANFGVGALRSCKFISVALTDSQMAGQTSEKLHVALAY